MSYILDALKKSEQERQRDAVPVLRGGARPASTPTGRRLAALAAVVALLAAGAATWLAGLWPADPVPEAGKRTKVPPVTDPATAERTTPAATPGGDAAATGAVAPSEEAPVPRRATPDTGSAKRNETGTGEAARQRVDALSVNVVSYSDAPERRFAMIDQRIVREAETVADGITVERIVPDGVVLGVDGTEVLLRAE